MIRCIIQVCLSAAKLDIYFKKVKAAEINHTISSCLIGGGNEEWKRSPDETDACDVIVVICVGIANFTNVKLSTMNKEVNMPPPPSPPSPIHGH